MRLELFLTASVDFSFLLEKEKTKKAAHLDGENGGNSNLFILIWGLSCCFSFSRLYLPVNSLFVRNLIRHFTNYFTLSPDADLADLT